MCSSETTTETTAITTEGSADGTIPIAILGQLNYIPVSGPYCMDVIANSSAIPSTYVNNMFDIYELYPDSESCSGTVSVEILSFNLDGPTSGSTFFECLLDVVVISQGSGYEAILCGPSADLLPDIPFSPNSAYEVIELAFITNAEDIGYGFHIRFCNTNCLATTGQPTTTVVTTQITGQPTSSEVTTRITGQPTTSEVTTGTTGQPTTPVETTATTGQPTTPVETTGTTGQTTTSEVTTGTTGQPTTPVATTTTTWQPTTSEVSTGTTGQPTTPVQTTGTIGQTTTPAATTTTTWQPTTPTATTTTTKQSTTAGVTTITTGQLTTPVETTETTGHQTTPAVTTQTTGQPTTPATTLVSTVTTESSTVELTTPMTTGTTSAITTNTTTTSTTTQMESPCNSNGDFLTLTPEMPCVTLCTPGYEQGQDYPPNTILKWRVKPARQCKGGTQIKFIGPVFHVAYSQRCNFDDVIIMKQRTSSGSLRMRKRCGKWSPEVEPNRGSFLFTQMTNTISIQFYSEKKLAKNGKGFKAQVCGLHCE